MITATGATESQELNEIVSRIWAKDHTLWSDCPTEITDRLGWLNITEHDAGRNHRADKIRA